MKQKTNKLLLRASTELVKSKKKEARISKTGVVSW